MIIDPAHQRRRIGQQLCAYGTELADSLQVIAVVEASDPGKGMYEKMGFVKQGWIETDVVPKYHWMIREPVQKNADA